MGNTLTHKMGTSNPKAAHEESGIERVRTSASLSYADAEKNTIDKPFFDPRSPSAGIKRTPVADRHDKGTPLSEKRMNVSSKGLRVFVGQKNLMMADFSDPRSPTIARSPHENRFGKENSAKAQPRVTA